jgi:hypothetical protein
MKDTLIFVAGALLIIGTYLLCCKYMGGSGGSSVPNAHRTTRPPNGGIGGWYPGYTNIRNGGQGASTPNVMFN